MMYEVQHSCGHKQKHEFTGDEKAVLEKIERESLRPCVTCKMYQSNNAALERQLPLLKGSTKQIAWAENIRNKYILIYKDLKQNFNYSPNKNKSTYAMLKIKNILETKSEASFWIENRDNLLSVKEKIEPYKAIKF